VFVFVKLTRQKPFTTLLSALTHNSSFMWNAEFSFVDTSYLSCCHGNKWHLCWNSAKV